jgi:hypothetical protein
MFEQLGLISAILGGFAFTFVGAILTIDRSHGIVSAAYLIGVVTAVIFFVCTVGWSLMSFAELSKSDLIMETLREKHRLLSFFFIMGIFSLNCSLALSGFIRSRITGIVSTIIATIGLIAILYIIKDFIR